VLRKIGEFDESAVFIAVDLIKKSAVTIVDFSREGGERSSKSVRIRKILEKLVIKANS